MLPKWVNAPLGNFFSSRPPETISLFPSTPAALRVSALIIRWLLLVFSSIRIQRPFIVTRYRCLFSCCCHPLSSLVVSALLSPVFLICLTLFVWVTRRPRCLCVVALIRCWIFDWSCKSCVVEKKLLCGEKPNLLCWLEFVSKPLRFCFCFWSFVEIWWALFQQNHHVPHQVMVMARLN